jgi:protein involved in temperature-dependent protein secretion
VTVAGKWSKVELQLQRKVHARSQNENHLHLYLGARLEAAARSMQFSGSSTHDFGNAVFARSHWPSTRSNIYNEAHVLNCT